MKKLTIPFLLLLLLNGVTSDSDTDVFDDLARRLGPELRQGTEEYGILYMPIKKASFLVQNQTALDNVRNQRRNNPMNYPMIKAQNIAVFGEIFSNYAIVVPQYLSIGAHRIHAEKQLIDHVSRKMLAWIHKNYNQVPSKIYLYTYFLPCKHCVRLVESFIRNNRQSPVILGYSSIVWNMANEGKSQIIKTFGLLENAGNGVKGTRVLKVQSLEDCPIYKLIRGVRC